MNAPKPAPPKQKLHVDPAPQTKMLSSDIRELTEALVKNDVTPAIPEKRDDETMQQYSDRLDALRPKKRVFVQKMHLTQRAFQGNQDLLDLKEKLEKKPPVKRNPHRKTSTKTQEKK